MAHHPCFSMLVAGAKGHFCVTLYDEIVFEVWIKLGGGTVICTITQPFSAKHNGEAIPFKSNFP